MNGLYVNFTLPVNSQRLPVAKETRSYLCQHTYNAFG